MKRKYRNDMPQQQKDKIAAANQGKSLSMHTRELIAQAMREYWASLPLKPQSEQQQRTGITAQPQQPPISNPYKDN